MSMWPFSSDDFHARKQVAGVPRPLVLLILDGFGEAPLWGGNAEASAAMPNFFNYLRNFPHASLDASGQAVGLPPRTRGNSEAGHLNLGAGRIVKQDYSYISSLIHNQSFFDNPALNGAITYAVEHGTRLHLLGLFGQGTVHSSADHLYALLELIRWRISATPGRPPEVLLHLFTDGRDAPPMSGLTEIAKLTRYLQTSDLSSYVRIASLSGRFYAMDRDNRWERTSQAWRAIAKAEGEVMPTAEQVLQSAYARGLTDEFLVPTVIASASQPKAPVENNDAFIFFNFRPDRARQLTAAFTVPDMHKMQIDHKFDGLYFVTFVRYEDRLPAIPAFHPAYPKEPLGAVLAKYGLRQFHIAETEKYAHVTYFFNGGHEQPYPGEERFLVPSVKVATYDQAPEMSARAITAEVTARIRRRHDDVIILNFANPDMVGHTGNFPATVAALTLIDQLVGQIVQETWNHHGAALLTADHGNAEEMLNPKSGEAETEHTMNPVPFLYIPSDQSQLWPLRPQGVLADVAPTMLQLLQCPLGFDMTGVSLFDLNHQTQVPAPDEIQAAEPTTITVPAPVAT